MTAAAVTVYAAICPTARLPGNQQHRHRYRRHRNRASHEPRYPRAPYHACPGVFSPQILVCRSFA